MSASGASGSAGGGDVGRVAARGTAKLMAAQAISMASGYVVAVVLARGLGPEAYGVYGIILSVLLATELIGRLGIPQVTSKLIAEGRPDQALLERTSLTLTLAIYLVVAAAFAAAAPLLAALFDLEGGTRLLRIAALDIPFYGMFFATQHVLNGERRFGVESLGVSLYGVSKAVGVSLLLLVGVSVERALLANVGASILGFAYFASRLSPGAFRPALALARPLLRLAVPTSLVVLASQTLANLDLWSLKWMAASERAMAPGTTDETIGLYVAATNIARLPSVVHFVMAAVLVPSVSRAASAEGREAVTSVVRAAFRFLLFLLVPACGWLALRSTELMRLVYDEEYVAGAVFQALLVFRFGLLTTLVMTASSVFLALGKPGVAARCMLPCIPVGALVLALCIRGFGATGAAGGAVATLAVATALTMFALWREIGPIVARRDVLAALGALAVVAVATRLVHPTTAWLAVDGLVSVALTVLVLSLVGGFRPRELLAFLGGRRGRG